jgi:hypothetical protein
MFDLIIRGDQVVTPQGTGAWDICIEGETIAAIARPGQFADDQAGRVIDATGTIELRMREKTILGLSGAPDAATFAADLVEMGCLEFADTLFDQGHHAQIHQKRVRWRLQGHLHR